MLFKLKRVKEKNHTKFMFLKIFVCRHDENEVPSTFLLGFKFDLEYRSRIPNKRVLLVKRL